MIRFLVGIYLITLVPKIFRKVEKDNAKKDYRINISKIKH